MDTTEEVTASVALKNAARLLKNAELESDLARLALIMGLADSWVEIARMIKGEDPLP